MGNKSGRTGKYVLFYFAVSIIIAALLNTVCLCAGARQNCCIKSLSNSWSSTGKVWRQVFLKPLFSKANRCLQKTKQEPPADVALYALGEVYAHHDYQGRDYVLSQYYFEKLIENFPDSPLTSEAKTYVSLFETIAAEEKLTAAAEEKASPKEK